MPALCSIDDRLVFLLIICDCYRHYANIVIEYHFSINSVTSCDSLDLSFVSVHSRISIMLFIRHYYWRNMGSCLSSENEGGDTQHQASSRSGRRSGNGGNPSQPGTYIKCSGRVDTYCWSMLFVCRSRIGLTATPYRACTHSYFQLLEKISHWNMIYQSGRVRHHWLWVSWWVREMNSGTQLQLLRGERRFGMLWKPLQVLVRTEILILRKQYWMVPT